MAEGKTYISWATKFDTYKGALNWQDLSLSERATIARYVLEGMPEGLDIEEFVMSTNLRRLQFDGLTTVILRTALALEDRLGVCFTSGDGTKYSLVLPYLEGTALGQEMIALLNGTAGDHTSYRMGELEFLAQSGLRMSPLDKLFDVPQDIRLQGILELLKPKGAFDPQQRRTDERESDTITGNLDKLPFRKAMRLIEARRLNMRASYTGSLQAVSQGVVKIGAVDTMVGIASWAAPAAGLLAAFFVAWWWLPIGLILGLSAFRYSRQAASQAVLRRASTDEAFFEAMRKSRVLWLEDIEPL